MFLSAPDRSRRRSGNGLVRVGSEVGTLEKKRAVDDVTGESLDMMVMMTTLDNGPHREMAVDVPDSFIARNKTPPRYPPPSRANRATGTQVKMKTIFKNAISPFPFLSPSLSPDNLCAPGALGVGGVPNFRITCEAQYTHFLHS